MVVPAKLQCSDIDITSALCQFRSTFTTAVFFLQTSSLYLFFPIVFRFSVSFCVVPFLLLSSFLPSFLSLATFSYDTSFVFYFVVVVVVVGVVEFGVVEFGVGGSKEEREEKERERAREREREREKTGRKEIIRDGDLLFPVVTLYEKERLNKPKTKKNE